MKDAVHITSRDNQHMKFARRVRDRKETDHIFVEGKRLCAEAISSGLEIERVFLSDKFADSEFLDRTKTAKFVVDERLFASIADTDSPQGIITLARRPPAKFLDELFASDDQNGSPLWVCMEKPNNPSNLGAVIRTAEGAGVRGVAITSGSADPFAPKALRASMGSAFRVPIATAASVREIFEAARSKGISIAAMDAGGSNDYLELDWTKPTLLVIGSEADGLSREAVDAADHSIRIEMKKPVESLNLAVSAGIVLFEAARQNRLANR